MLRLDSLLDIHTFPVLSNFLFPLTLIDFIEKYDEDWIISLSTVYFIAKIILPIDQKRLNNNEDVIKELRAKLSAQVTSTNSAINDLATISNNRDVWRSKYLAEQSAHDQTVETHSAILKIQDTASLSLSTALGQEKHNVGTLTAQSELDYSENTQLRRLLEVSRLQFKRQIAATDKAVLTMAALKKAHAQELFNTRLEIVDKFSRQLWESRNTRVAKKLSVAKSELSITKSELIATRSELATAQVKLAEIHDDSVKLKTSQSALMTKVQQVSALQTESAALKSEKAALEKQLTAAKSGNAGSSGQPVDVDALLARERENMKLHTQVGRAEKKVTEMEKTVAEKDASILALNKRMDELRGEKEALKSGETASKEFKEMEDALEETSVQLNQAKAVLKEREKECKSMETDAAAHEIAIEFHKSKIANLQAEVKEKIEEIDLLKEAGGNQDVADSSDWDLFLEEFSSMIDLDSNVSPEKFRRYLRWGTAEEWKSSWNDWLEECPAEMEEILE